MSPLGRARAKLAILEPGKDSEGAGIECTPGRARPTAHTKMEKSIVMGVFWIFMSRKTVMSWVLGNRSSNV